MQQIVHSVMVGPAEAENRKQCLKDIILYVEQAMEGRQSQYDLIKARPPPRCMKTHLSVNYYQRFLDGPSDHCPKFIIVDRNPKDTLVSFYHFHRMISSLQFGETSWDQFFEMFKENRLCYGNLVDFNIGWWKYRDHPNVLFVHYEEMLKNNAPTIHKIGDLLGRTLSSEDVSAVVQQASFEKMRERGLGSYIKSTNSFNEGLSPFFRKGKSGDWHNYFSEEQSEYVDFYVEAHARPVGLNYTY